MHVPNTPLKYILIAGVLWFGGSLTAFMIISDLLLTSDVRTTATQLPRTVILGTVGGLVFGSITWLFLRVTQRHRRQS